MGSSAGGIAVLLAALAVLAEASVQIYPTGPNNALGSLLYGQVLNFHSDRLVANDSHATLINFLEGVACNPFREEGQPCLVKEPGWHVQTAVEYILVATRDESMPIFVNINLQPYPAILGSTLRIDAERTNGTTVTRHTLVGSVDKQRRWRLFAHTAHPLAQSESLDIRRPNWRLVAPLASSRPRVLRVATYNIWNVMTQKDGPSYAARIRLVRDMLGARSSDLIALQEVRYDSENHRSPLGPNQLDHIRRHPSLRRHQFVFQPAMSYLDNLERRVDEGLALLTPHRMSADYILLPRDRRDRDDFHQRICQHAELIVPGFSKPVHVFHTHLSLSPKAQRRAALRIARYMQQFPTPQLLVGDLNAEPNSDMIQFFMGKKTIGGIRTSGWRDAWLEIHNEPRAGSDDPGFTFSQDNPRKRIDYIFVVGDELAVTAADTFGANPDVWASDHLGLAARIEWRD